MRGEMFGFVPARSVTHFLSYQENAACAKKTVRPRGATEEPAAWAAQAKGILYEQGGQGAGGLAADAGRAHGGAGGRGVAQVDQLGCRQRAPDGLPGVPSAGL